MLLTCANRRRVAVTPAVAEPVVVPVPPVTAPVEVADAEIAVRVAVDGAPEEHSPALPAFGDELMVGQQVVEDAGVQDGLTFQLLAKLVADDRAVLLPFIEVESDGVAAPLELATLLVLEDFPAVGDEGVGVTVDYSSRDRDLQLAANEAPNQVKVRRSAELCHIVGSVTTGLQRVAELVHLADRVQH